MPGAWRIVLISSVTPVVEALVPYVRELGHEPVAVLAPRRPPGSPAPGFAGLSDETAPAGLDLLFAKDKWSLAPLLRGHKPDLALCWGFPWKIPAEALAVPRHGIVNNHPALLPRHRGPVPMAWAFREGDPHIGMTWHRMDAELDTGSILAQTTIPIEDEDTTILDVAPRLLQAAFETLPRALDRVAAGDAGDAQPDEGATWAGHFGEDYAVVDWSQPARAIHNQVRAWHFTFGLAPVAGPIAELDGARVKLLRTSLSEHPDAVARVETGDAPLWILEHEPA